jgi:hypothetical protein
MRATGVIAGLCLTAVALVLSAQVEAATPAPVQDQWKYIGANDKGERFFYDASSVIRMSGDLLQVWTRKLTGEGAEKRLEEINCSSKVIRDIQVVSERQQKNIPPRLIGRKDWRAMELDPITNELHKVLCR